METLFDFLKAAAGMALLLSAWFGVQAMVRLLAGRPHHEDVLDHMAHGGCGGCSNRGQCTKQDHERNHHDHESA